MKTKLSLLLCCLLFAGCTLLNRTAQDKATLFSQHLAFWQNLRIDGVVEVNYQQFQFRKTAVLRVNPGTIKLTIVDTGLFGLNPEPFLEAIIDSTGLALTTNGTHRELSADSLNQLLPDLHSFLHPEDMNKFQQEIFTKGFFATPTTCYYFDDQLRLTRIQRKSGIQIVFDWGSELQSIAIINGKKTVATLHIDTIKKRSR